MFGREDINRGEELREPAAPTNTIYVDVEVSACVCVCVCAREDVCECVRL